MSLRSSPLRQPPPASAWLFRWFAWYARGYLRRHFHAVRLAGRERLAARDDEPLVVYLNHPAWWDPLIGLHLAATFFPGRRHYAPIDARALQKYRFLGRLGFFGVEQDRLRGAAEFLRTAEAILASPSTAIWLTPQGEFADVRRRPVSFKPGLAHLARRAPQAAYLPVAVEYPFWSERLPEALLYVGAAVRPADEAPGGTADEWSRLLESRLAAAQDELAALAQARDGGAFETLLAGGAGVGGAYDLWRRAGAWLRGRRFEPRHAALEPSPESPRDA